MFITYFHKFDASRIERDKWQGCNSTGFRILGHVLSNWCCLTSEHASDESVNKEVSSAFDDRIKDGITVFIEE